MDQKTCMDLVSDKIYALVGDEMVKLRKELITS